MIDPERAKAKLKAMFEAEDWKYGWQEHEDAQLLYGASLSFEEKLQWLEDAAKLAEQFAAAREARENSTAAQSNSTQPE